MNTLNGYSKSTLTDKYVLTAAGGHRYIYDSEFIIGTQTAATGSWTGVSIDSELYDGKQISYWLPFNGSGNATLNLTLAGGTTTGAVNCYYGGTSRLTTHYGAGNIIRLIYRKDVNIGGTTYTGWWADANYVDGNNYAYVRLYLTDTTATEYPLLFRYDVNVPTTYVTLYTRYDSAITVNPSTNTITASLFKGSLGDGTMTVKPERNNEVNFGGTNNSATIYFGYRATDSKPIPTKFVFGNISGTAELVAKTAVLSSVVSAGRYYLKYSGTTGTYAELQVNTRGTACTTEGTAGTTGIAFLFLGNSTAVSTAAGSGAENALGILRIYGTNTGYTNIRCGTHNTSGYNLYLPGASGLFVYHTNDTTIGGEHIPVYIAATGAATACTIVDGSGDADRKLLVTNGSNGIYSTATITGNYATGNLISTRTGENPIRHTCTNGIGSVSLLVHTNRGLYDSGNSYWMIYSTKDTTNVYIPKWASKGSATQPVYFNSSGAPALCTAYSGLLTALSSSSATNLSITVGGTTKSVTDLYARKLALSSTTITSTANDTVAKWGPLGTSVHFYSTTGLLTDQPLLYGLLLNVTTGGSEVHLIWMTLASGNLYHRGGNSAGWSGSWRTILDSSNSSVSGGGSSWGSSITIKINGTSKTLTIPSNPNTDSLVQQSKTTSGSMRPILMGYTQASAVADLETDVTNKSYVSQKFYAVPSTGALYATTFNGNLNGSITKSDPLLCAASENNNINIVNNANSAITTNSPASLASITKAIRFRWYDTYWLIGNIRSSSSDSSGFGITYSNSNLCFRVTTSGTYSYYNMYAPHFYENSDIQLKTNIQEILNSDKMPIIKEFDWKESNSHSYGLIAQELEEQGYSELVSTKDDGYKTVNYSAALSLIVGKLQVKIKELEKEIENLKNKN